ncbi:phosphoglycerate mutase [Devosia sp. LC5]|uniref:histidine phosphatase family protein n=1 Tax=Devosia sp. LC5 TaxID=1502724 RepID=UPI0004E41414|nr:histidine phosphatase family protein [Devosia sp. LC5]KFC68791.1 phosphoglycerate mutase [Devosia sp. LC5]
MGKLILIRHSAPLIDPAVPARDWMLSTEGQAASVTLAERLANHGIGAVISSDEPKACQTAEAIAATLQLPLEVDRDLREHERANVGFLPRLEFEAGIARFFAHPGELVFGEETADQVFLRFSAAVERSMGQNRGTIALLTHGTALTLYLARTTGIAPLPFWRALTLPMAIAVEGRALTVL